MVCGLLSGKQFHHSIVLPQHDKRLTKSTRSEYNSGEVSATGISDWWKSMDNDKGPRFEKEIRDLLDDMPEFLPEQQARAPIPLPKARVNRHVTTPTHTLRLAITSKTVAILAFVCLGLSYVVRPVAHQVSPFFGIATVALMVLALGLAVGEGRRMNYERRWRGRVITLPSDTPGWQIALGQWWWRARAGFRRWRHH